MRPNLVDNHGVFQIIARVGEHGHHRVQALRIVVHLVLDVRLRAHHRLLAVAGARNAVSKRRNNKGKEAYVRRYILLSERSEYWVAGTPIVCFAIWHW